MCRKTRQTLKVAKLFQSLLQRLLNMMRNSHVLYADRKCFHLSKAKKFFIPGQSKEFDFVA